MPLMHHTASILQSDPLRFAEPRVRSASVLEFQRTFCLELFCLHVDLTCGTPVEPSLCHQERDYILTSMYLNFTYSNSTNKCTTIGILRKRTTYLTDLQ
ncbi:hypothetical protein M0804_007707 [Polistes exclamans]|nr:hypothetical protein M0804_007707 [Polistes exclamans]